MLYYVTFAVALVLFVVALMFAGLVSVAAIAALLCLGALVEMVRVLKKPMDPDLSRRLVVLVGSIAIMLATIMFASSPKVQIVAAGALLAMAAIIEMVHKAWVTPEFGLYDQSSRLGEEAERFFESK